MPIGKLVFAQLWIFFHFIRSGVGLPLPIELSDQNLFASRSVFEHGVCAIDVSRKLARH